MFLIISPKNDASPKIFLCVSKQNLEENDKDYEIKWFIKKKAKTYVPGSSFCDLCNSEKLAILLADPEKALNKRSEILEMCRHRFPFKLKNYLT